MDEYTVLEHFMLYSGLDAKAAANWFSVVTACAEYVRRIVRKGVDIARNKKLLCDAAGALAFYRYTLAQYTDESAASFSAGDVKISTDIEKSCNAAKMLKDAAFESIKDIIETGDFYFCTTDGGAV